jgi:iron complex transport system ATP-binding protein
VSAPLCMERVGVVLGGRAIVDGLTLRVQGGEWVALIGPNGAGKTTALRAAAGHVRYTGSVQVGGREVARLSPRRLARELAVVPQTPTTPPLLTVTEYVMLGRTARIPYFGRESPADLVAVAGALRRLELEELSERPLASLSGGERQRAVLARALVQEAQVLLLDEPTSALDIGRQQAVLELVDCLRGELGLTVVAAMHDLTLAGQFADRLMLLSGGRVAAVGPPADVLTECRIADHYGARVDVRTADGQAPDVVPRRAAREHEAGAWRR